MKYLLSVLLLSICFTNHAQTQRLTIEDAVLKQRSSLAPERLNQLQWVKGTGYYAQVRTGKGKDSLILTPTTANLTAAVKQSQVYISLAQLNQALKDNHLDTLSKYPLLEQFNADYLQFHSKTSTVRYNWTANTIARIFPLDEKAENADQAELSGHIAYTIANNLYIRTAEGQVIAISNDGSDGLVYGKTVHRDEYGISKGTYWSPNGNKLAFYRMDQSMVTDYPVMNLDEHPAAAKLIKYPMAGMKSHEVSIGIYDVKTAKTTYLSIIGAKDQYLTNIAWSPDETKLYVAVLNRKTDHFWLNEYNVGNGQFLRNILEESDSIWLEPLHPLQFLKGDNTRAIWQSQRSGHNHLYLLNMNSAELIRPLTFGEWDVIDVLAAGKDRVYYTSTCASPLEVRLSSIDMKTFVPTLITNDPGVHTCAVNELTGTIIDQYSNATTPRVVQLIDAKQHTQTLLRAGNPLKNYQLGKMRFITLTAADGKTPLYARLILPPNFDSTKKYPCITYVYNGPHVQLVSNSWLGGADMWNYYMAQEGYIMFTIDGRGSDRRGAAFEKCIHRQLGTCELADQLVGNSYLRSLSYVDTSRMGIHGWSFGGFMTTALMTRTPGKYKVGVCGGPVIDWSYYEVMYTERYMDTPDENPQGYRTSNNLNYVENLKGKLLMIHGTSDDVVVWQHSLMYLKKCVEKGKQIDYFVYPGHLHNVIGKDRVHLMTKITDYFKSNL